MTYNQIAAMIKSIGLDFAYYQFDAETAVAPPFVCFYYESSDDVYADNTNYAKKETLVIELYTKEKEFALEALIGATLNANDLAYRRFESYIDSEKLIMNTFESEVFING